MKPKKEDEQGKTQALASQPKPEILPPASKVPALAPPDARAVPGFDLAEFERQIRQAAEMLNLAKPEGFLDRLFDRPDHRIEVKTERGQRLAAYVAACTALVQAANGFQNARRQAYLDHTTFLLRVAEEQQKLEAVTARFQLQMQVEEEKAKSEIEKYKADAREHGLRGRLAPPPLPPPPPPKPEDPRAKNKARLRQELDRLAKEEKEDLAKISGGKPQGEWTDEMHEEIKRTVNMYFHAKEKVREELRQYV